MKCPKCAQEMTPIIYPTMPPKRGYTCFGCGFKIDESDFIELKPKEISSPKFRCATCDNEITALRAPEFPICDESDFIELKPKEISSPKFRCATCDNEITALRALEFPICDDCLKDLSEIIKEKRNAKR